MKFLNAYAGLQNGDQLTFVQVNTVTTGMASFIDSIVLNESSTEAIPSFITVGDGIITIFDDTEAATAAAVIVSREGANGSHLRNNTTLKAMPEYANAPEDDAAKQAAIESYMSQGANTDWAEESIM